jgi:hypothetical protein
MPLASWLPHFTWPGSRERYTTQPAERRNGAVMQVRGSVVIMMQLSVCPRLHGHGIGFTYFPTAYQPSQYVFNQYTVHLERGYRAFYPMRIGSFFLVDERDTA